MAPPHRDDAPADAPAKPSGGWRLAAAVLFGAAWFAWLLFSRWETLQSPPYVEHAGWWAEASYLADTDFDYPGLWRRPHGAVGGPRGYFSSIMPSTLALLMQRWGPQTTLPVVHLATFASASLTAAALVWLAWPRVGPASAILLGLVLSCIPLWSVQTELPSLDLLMTAALVPALVLLDRGRLFAAAAASIPAFLIKNSAFLFPAAVGAYAAVLAVLPPRGDGPRRQGAAATAAFCALLVITEYAIVVAAENTASRLRFFFDVGLWLLSTPYLLLVALLAAPASAWHMRRLMKARIAAGGGARAFGEIWREQPLFFAGWLLIALNAVSILAVAFEARYLVLALPCLLFNVAALLGALPQLRRGSPVLLAAALAFNVGNRHGRWLPPLPGQVARGWGVPERSLEYRADHASNRRLTEALAAQARQRDLLVCDQFVFFLQLPRLGYVLRPLAGDPPPYFFVTEHENVAQLLDESPAEIAVGYVPSQLGELEFPAYCIAAPSDQDEVVQADGLIPENVVYVHRCRAGAAWDERCREIVDLLFANAVELDAAARLAIVGFEPQARRLAAAALGADPASPQATRELSERLAAIGAVPQTSPRLKELTARRIRKLDAGRPLTPLTWHERGLDEFIPQRFRYCRRVGGPVTSQATTEP